MPTVTEMASPISPDKEILQVKSVLEKRDQELIFLITKELIKYHFSDEEGNPRFQKFTTLKNIVTQWYNEKVIVLNLEPQYKKLLYFEEPKKIVGHIARGINPQLNTTEHIRPVFNYYNKFSSTKYVNGNTVKDVYWTQKSHVNAVVMDSDWEGICAKTLEEIETVECYVKNQFLGFAIPYTKDGKDKQYFPDFIVRVKSNHQPLKTKYLIIEISGMSNDKAEKKWFVENRWIPAVNALKEKYEYPEWHFIEIANDIRNIKNQLIEKIQSI
jgi:type III restriction enzyme